MTWLGMKWDGHDILDLRRTSRLVGMAEWLTLDGTLVGNVVSLDGVAFMDTRLYIVITLKDQYHGS